MWVFERKRERQGWYSSIINSRHKSSSPLLFFFFFFLLNVKLLHPDSQLSWQKFYYHILETSHGWVTLTLSRLQEILQCVPPPLPSGHPPSTPCLSIPIRATASPPKCLSAWHSARGPHTQLTPQPQAHRPGLCTR